VVDVQQQRSYEVDWRFISLWILNEETNQEWYTPAYRAGHYLGHKGLRIANAIRLQEDGEAVGSWYAALGEALHLNNRRDEARADNEAFLEAVLDEAGFSAAYLSDADDESHDEYIRAETELALSRAGNDVGAPKGVEASELWDAIEKLAVSGVAELKRSNRDAPDYT
jgi:hypothetical protein